MTNWVFHLSNFFPSLKFTIFQTRVTTNSVNFFLRRAGGCAQANMTSTASDRCRGLVMRWILVGGLGFFLVSTLVTKWIFPFFNKLIQKRSLNSMPIWKMTYCYEFFFGFPCCPDVWKGRRRGGGKVGFCPLMFTCGTNTDQGRQATLNVVCSIALKAVRSAHTRGLVAGTCCRDKPPVMLTRWDWLQGQFP